MHAKNFVIYEGGNGHTVENVLKLFPNSDGVAAFALIVEPVNSVDLAAFVVSSEEEEVFLVLDLVCKEEENDLERLLAAVDVITEEKVVGLGRKASILKKLDQVGKLTVHVSTNLDWGFQLQEDWLLHEDFTRYFQQRGDLLLLQLHVFAVTVDRLVNN